MRPNRNVAIGLAALILVGVGEGCRRDERAGGTPVTKEVPFSPGGAPAGDNAAAPPGNDNGPRVIPYHKGPPPRELPPGPGQPGGAPR